MRLPHVFKRQDCGSGYQFYLCSNGPGFRGCCSIDPCSSGVCPAANLQGGDSATPTATPGSTTTNTITTAFVTIRPSATLSTSRATSTVTPESGAAITTSITAASPTAMSTYSIYETYVITAEPSVYTTMQGGSVTTVTAAAERSTITLNPGTKTITGGSGAASTGLSDNAAAGSEGSKGSNLGPIVGGVVGGIIFLALLLIAVILVKRRRRDEQSQYGVAEKQGFFGMFMKRDAAHSPNLSTDAKHPMSPPPPGGFAEMPSPSFIPPGHGPTLPYGVAELDSDVVSMPSELSSGSTPLYQSSGWSPTPVPSAVSTSSTGAVLSPQRETHYSDSSTAGGTSQRYGQPSQQNSQVQELGSHAGHQLYDQGPQSGQRSNLSVPQLGTRSGSGSGSGLRGGGLPGMMAELSGSLRRKTGRGGQQPPVPQPPPQQSPPQQQQRPPPGTHVMSWMNYESDSGSAGQGGLGGVVR